MNAFFFIAVLSSLPAVFSLSCLSNCTVTNSVRTNGKMKGTTNNYYLGVLECSEKLTLCVAFTAMDVSFFNTLDVAQEKNTFTNLIRPNNGKVAGRSCMSEADAVKIQAVPADECTGFMASSCSCTTDGCTGGASTSLSLMGLLAILLFFINKN
ncbi:hypothetical protein PFISCL1PPCAC_12846 [Pristionchus fissidentatus]|uniref:Uncharacterized protein n=1 Tax=Pristionchus fissidentatus TaxID=1538716 RepID=A0AAV5VUW7_9BILA|nr:hypothetical protein PFISCL1PPCAC_12846 [Pristionchus fissidentatus]